MSEKDSFEEAVKILEKMLECDDAIFEVYYGSFGLSANRKAISKYEVIEKFGDEVRFQKIIEEIAEIAGMYVNLGEEKSLTKLTTDSSDLEFAKWKLYYLGEHLLTPKFVKRMRFRLSSTENVLKTSSWDTLSKKLSSVHGMTTSTLLQLEYIKNTSPNEEMQLLLELDYASLEKFIDMLNEAKKTMEDEMKS